jgi:hypothetical protein
MGIAGTAEASLGIDHIGIHEHKMETRIHILAESSPRRARSLLE